MSVQRIAALSLQQELIDKGANATVKKFGPEYGNVYSLDTRIKGTEQWPVFYCTVDGRVLAWIKSIDCIDEPFEAYEFARTVIKARLPAHEALIGSNAKCAYYYSSVIVRGRWPEGEPIISTDPEYSWQYAKHVIKSRFPAGEPVIKRHQACNKLYEKFLAEIGETRA